MTPCYFLPRSIHSIVPSILWDHGCRRCRWNAVMGEATRETRGVGEQGSRGGKKGSHWRSVHQAACCIWGQPNVALGQWWQLYIIFAWWWWCRENPLLPLDRDFLPTSNGISISPDSPLGGDCGRQLDGAHSMHGVCKQNEPENIEMMNFLINDVLVWCCPRLWGVLSRP